MRKEADDIGPAAELDHWKKRMAKFNSLLEQIKSPRCKATVGVLHAAKSKVLKQWKQLVSGNERLSVIQTVTCKSEVVLISETFSLFFEYLCIRTLRAHITGRVKQSL